MRRFDKYVEEQKIKQIKLIKIDVELYEFPVLKGFRNYFVNTSDRPIIICEIFPKYYPIHGATLEEFLEYMRRYGYKVFNLSNPQEEVKTWTDNVIFKVS